MDHHWIRSINYWIIDLLPLIRRLLILISQRDPLYDLTVQVFFFLRFKTFWSIDHWIGNLLSLIPIDDWQTKLLIFQEAPSKYAELKRIVRIR